MSDELLTNALFRELGLVVDCEHIERQRQLHAEANSTGRQGLLLSIRNAVLVRAFP
jgi:hypothetical protein